MDGWGVSTEKDDPVKYEHDEITCKSFTFRMALFCAEKVDFLLKPIVPNFTCNMRHLRTPAKCIHHIYELALFIIPVDDLYTF